MPVNVGNPYANVAVNSGINYAKNKAINYAGSKIASSLIGGAASDVLPYLGTAINLIQNPTGKNFRDTAASLALSALVPGGGALATLVPALFGRGSVADTYSSIARQRERDSLQARINNWHLANDVRSKSTVGQRQWWGGNQQEPNAPSQQGSFGDFQLPNPTEEQMNVNAMNRNAFYGDLQISKPIQNTMNAFQGLKLY